MNNLNAIREDLSTKINYGGMNQFEMESVYAGACVDEREAWSEASDINRFIQAQAATDNQYAVEMEGFEEDEVPALSEMENAFTAAIKKFWSAVKTKVESIIATITKWVDEKMDAMDEKWWDTHSELAFGEYAKGIKEQTKMVPWAFANAKKTSELEAEAQKYLDAVEKAEDAFSSAESVKDSDDKTKVAADKTGGANVMGESNLEKGKDKLNDVFTGGKSYTKKENVKFSTFVGSETVLKDIFLKSRADRAVMKAFKKDMEALKKVVSKLSTTNFGEDDAKGISAVKKTVNQCIVYAKTSISLIMSRRSDIKMIVSKLYSAAAAEKSKKDAKDNK